MPKFTQLHYRKFCVLVCNEMFLTCFAFFFLWQSLQIADDNGVLCSRGPSKDKKKGSMFTSRWRGGCCCINMSSWNISSWNQNHIVSLSDSFGKTFKMNGKLKRIKEKLRPATNPNSKWKRRQFLTSTVLVIFFCSSVMVSWSDEGIKTLTRTAFTFIFIYFLFL